VHPPGKREQEIISAPAAIGAHPQLVGERDPLREEKAEGTVWTAETCRRFGFNAGWGTDVGERSNLGDRQGDLLSHQRLGVRGDGH
jgi:hypothetical protein